MRIMQSINSPSLAKGWIRLGARSATDEDGVVESRQNIYYKDKPVKPLPRRFARGERVRQRRGMWLCN